MLDFIYDDAYEFIDGIAYVKQGGRHGFIDRKGHLMSAPIPSVSAASGYEPLNDYERYILDDAEFVRYEENGYIGYKDASSGQIVIRPISCRNVPQEDSVLRTTRHGARNASGVA